MSNIQEYIEKYGHQTFDDLPLNEVDMLFFNELTFMPLDDIFPVTFSPNETKTFEDVHRILTPNATKYNQENPFLVTKSRIKLWTTAARSPRYRDLKFGFYINVLQNGIENVSEQFTALSIFTPVEDSKIIVLFGGTNETLVGWYENAYLVTEGIMPAHISAKDYLDQIITYTSGEILVTGYSKGANLAIYASAFCRAPERVQKIYAFDGPGFQEEFIQHEKYQSILPKVFHYIPEDSIVGVLLHHGKSPIIIKSRLFSILQHYLGLWEIDLEEICLVRQDEVAFQPQVVNRIANAYLEKYSSKDIHFFIKTLFGGLLSIGIHDINQLIQGFRDVQPGFQDYLTNINEADQDRFQEMFFDFGKIAQKIFQKDFHDQAEDLKKDFEAFNDKIMNFFN